MVLFVVHHHLILVVLNIYISVPVNGGAAPAAIGGAVAQAPVNGGAAPIVMVVHEH